jgi:hypothetical protein
MLTKSQGSSKSGGTSKVLQSLKNFKDWKKYTAENPEFPFDALICDHQEKGPLQLGDKLRVAAVDGYDDLRGVLVVARQGRNKYWFQLLDLEAVDKTSRNQQIIEAYQDVYADLVAGDG